MVFRTGFICIALMAVSSIGSATAKLGQCSRSYTVQTGDTCNSICASQGVSTYQLAYVNSGIINAGCGNIKPNEILCLGIKNQDCLKTHVVKSGDTCDAIVKKDGITIDTLHTNNPNLNAECFITVGEVLCVDKVDIQYSEQASYAAGVRRRFGSKH